MTYSLFKNKLILDKKEELNNSVNIDKYNYMHIIVKIIEFIEKKIPNNNVKKYINKYIITIEKDINEIENDIKNDIAKIKKYIKKMQESKESSYVINLEKDIKCIQKYIELIKECKSNIVNIKKIICDNEIVKKVNKKNLLNFNKIDDVLKKTDSENIGFDKIINNYIFNVVRIINKEEEKTEDNENKYLNNFFKIINVLDYSVNELKGAAEVISIL
jgi:hypothetical protein